MFNLGTLGVHGGVAKLEIINPDGTVAHTEIKHNAVLDHVFTNYFLSSGADLDFIFTAEYSADTTPIKDRDTGITASQSGTTLTLSSSLTGVAAGTCVKWDSGEEAYIVSGSGTTWTVDRSQTVASGLFSNFRVNRTSVTSPVASTSTSTTDTYTTVSNVGKWTATSTISWPTVGGPVSINSVLIKIGNIPFSIIVFDTTQNLVAGQQPRLTYTAEFSFSTASGAVSFTVTGLGTFAGTGGEINSGTNNDGYKERFCNRGPASSGYTADPVIEYSTSSAAFPAFGSTVEATAGYGLSLGATTKVNSSWVTAYTKTFSTLEANDAIRYFIFARVNYSWGGRKDWYAVRLDSALTKTNLYELTINFTRTLTRTLV